MTPTPAQIAAMVEMEKNTDESRPGYAKRIREYQETVLRYAPALLRLAAEAGVLREALERIETTDHLDTCDYIRSYSRGVPCNCHVVIARSALSQTAEKGK